MTWVPHQLREAPSKITAAAPFSSQLVRHAAPDRATRSVWWGADGDDFANLSRGYPSLFAPPAPGSLGRPATATKPISRPSLPNLTSDRIRVPWGFGTSPSASDFGHVVLPTLGAGSSDPGLSPAPSPSSVPGDARSKKPVHRAPTMMENCRTISPKFRLRWSLGSDSISIGLEAAVESQYYMAFGWADPKLPSVSMIGADVTVAGFTEEAIPFAEDYYITNYSECLLNKDGNVEGVCPDRTYQGLDANGLVNNSRLVYGLRRDGVSFVRFDRLLNSTDNKYDIYVDRTANMTVIWAMGLIRPPDALRPYYLPQNHGGPKFSSFGYFAFNVSEVFDDCLGPLDSEYKEDRGLIVSDGKTPVVVTSGPALHYPNPPNPSKVLYINKKEAPLLRVERGVPVTFSIQAGHDIAFYITSDPIGGNATSRNSSEIVYAGGSHAHGVQASPMDLVWSPDRNTPDQVYYHSVFEQKMGWKIDVVDGGLSDMYNNSVYLDDQQVSLFWTLSPDSNSISVAARGEKKSGYVAIGFGGEMVNSFAYVGWVDSNGVGRVSTYWIDGRDAMSVHPTKENLTYVRCKSENGIITFEFTRPLNPSCNGRVECKNIIDSTTPMKVVWAMGAKWSDENLSERNMHSVTSSKPVRVLWLRGSAEADQDLRPVLAVHGFMMFVAWGILLPGGIMAARYLKHVKGDGWYQIHVYLQYSGISIVLLGVLFAAAELRGFFVTSVHVKFGLAAIILACVQPVNAYLRPKKPVNGEVASTRRILWEYFHVITGRSAIIVGIVALFTGMKHLGHRYGSENVDGLTWALILWVLFGLLLAMYLEYLEWKQRRRDGNSFRGNWVLGNGEEDDSVDLLHPNRTVIDSESNSNGRMEVQLEPLNR
ncbi:cytochrome b561, DM13 and DOMON domain-containing protein At5g54830 [Asparagus officinalis]|uniref:cytochrome b561, DM13 and DOMON domain-containing protein At5g54830 n=1 Tax=Asparagus officinalis TaxID=4686 RepID=UPI00098E468E|nr:cytochrome b561, DM13 and DOMON domain-containing protein At5g54830 [Asparagus officinalis]